MAPGIALDRARTCCGVFKTRPLPATRREAIALMLDQPNLIRRPVLVKGARVVFGFDKARYDALFGSQ